MRPTYNNQIKKEGLRAPIIQGVNDCSWPEAVVSKRGLSQFVQGTKTMKIFPSSFLHFLCTPAFYFVTSLILMPVTVAQAQSLLSSDERAEIHNLYAQYNLVLDAGDSQSWADTFIEDGSFNTFVGREALIAFADGFATANPNTRHWNSSIRITPTADGAAGTAYLMLWKVSTQPAEVVLTGIYTDELVKTSKGWRFKARLIEVDQPANP